MSSIFKGEPDSRRKAGFRIDEFYFAAEGYYDLAAYRKAETGSAGRSGARVVEPVETKENFFAHFRRYALASIAYFEYMDAVGFFKTYFHGSAFGRMFY